MSETPRQRQVRIALEDFEFYASGRQAVREIDEVVAAREGAEVMERECRLCGITFTTRLPATGTKWTQSCPWCLQDEI